MAKLYLQFLTGVKFHLSVVLYVKQSEWLLTRAQKQIKSLFGYSQKWSPLLIRVVS